ncbi:MAG: hypothetical protein HY996_11765 [Micrococcales bacterium]|nr:hypothetical protein [Micrococcales bacterium]
MVIVLALVLWILGILLTAAALAAVLVAVRRDRPLLALPALVLVLLGLVLVAGGVAVPAPTRVLPLIEALLLSGIGIVGGGPLTVAVLARVTRDDEPQGEHGGILVHAEGITGDAAREVLRGGGVIGYLERIAVVGAVAVGRPEALAIVVAIKGLGRFSELETSAARERFIIGTLVSLIWACACGGLVWAQLR